MWLPLTFSFLMVNNHWEVYFDFVQYSQHVYLVVPTGINVTDSGYEHLLHGHCYVASERPSTRRYINSVLLLFSFF